MNVGETANNIIEYSLKLVGVPNCEKTKSYCNLFSVFGVSLMEHLTENLFAAILQTDVFVKGDEHLNRYSAAAAALAAVWLIPAMPAAAASDPPPITDVNGDGKITIEDALIIAGQMSADNSSAQNSGSEPSGGSVLPENIPIPDSIAVYTGYDSFDRDMLTVQAGEAFTLTLTHTGFDKSLNSVTTPVAGAVITFNGHDSGYVTDDRGTVTLSLPNAGAITVSAQTESEQTVPPLAQVLVIGKTAETQAVPAAFANVPTDAGTDYETPLITTGITEAPEAVLYAPIASPPMGDADAKALPPTVPVLSGCAILAAAGAACRNKKQKKSDDII